MRRRTISILVLFLQRPLENTLLRGHDLVQPPRRLLPVFPVVVLVLLTEVEAMLDSCDAWEEERGLLRRLWGLLRLVALGDDFEVEKSLPARAWQERKRDEVTI